MSTLEKLADEGKSMEQLARDMLERAGVDNAQSMTAGDLVEIANLIAKAEGKSDESLQI